MIKEKIKQIWGRFSHLIIVVVVLLGCFVGYKVYRHYNGGQFRATPNTTLSTIGREARQNNKVALVFYEPQCPYCHALEPVWKQEFSKESKTGNEPVPIYINAKTKEGQRIFKYYVPTAANRKVPRIVLITDNGTLLHYYAPTTLKKDVHLKKGEHPKVPQIKVDRKMLDFILTEKDF